MKNKKRKQEEVVPPRVRTANDFVNVRDIKGEFLYTKDDYLFGFLRIYPYNLDLLSLEEKQLKTHLLAASFDGDKGSFDYFTFPREVDLDNYKNYLKEKHKAELDDLGRRRLLLIMMKTAQELSTTGENYEHQHFIKLWQKIVGKHEAEAKHDLRVRLEEFKARYAAAGIKSEIVTDAELIKLCNLFGNSQQVSNEVIDNNLLYTPIPQLI